MYWKLEALFKKLGIIPVSNFSRNGSHATGLVITQASSLCCCEDKVRK